MDRLSMLQYKDYCLWKSLLLRLVSLQEGLLAVDLVTLKDKLVCGSCHEFVQCCH